MDWDDLGGVEFLEGFVEEVDLYDGCWEEDEEKDIGDWSGESIEEGWWEYWGYIFGWKCCVVFK